MSMRTTNELFDLLRHVAISDERIRVMTLEGSRVNPNATPDIWQDYDVTFLVVDLESFTQSDEWLKVFGDIVIMQKPEAMELFPPDIPAGWFSYLMLFADGIKIDLTLVPLADINQYLKQDPLIKVLIDKDGICPELPSPSDKQFWIQKPSAVFVDDCANEFCFSSTYAAKGLLRNELLCANWIFEHIMRVELFRMLGYLSGVRNGFPLNTGKHDKFLLHFLSDNECEAVLKTYRLEDVDAAWDALYTALDLFGNALVEVCDSLSYPCPYYLEKVKEYIEMLRTMK